MKVATRRHRRIPTGPCAADGSAGGVLGDEHLLKRLRENVREAGRLVANAEQEPRHVVSLGQAAAIEIVTPANDTTRRFPVNP
jgi:hypothetical protein